MFLYCFSLIFVACSEDEDSTPSSEKDIISFTLQAKDHIGLSEDQAGVIDQGSSSIVVTLPSDIDLRTLTPTMILSAKSRISPSSGLAQDFSNGPVDYTVEAENGEKRIYSVAVLPEDERILNINAFRFLKADNTGLAQDYTGDITLGDKDKPGKITLQLPEGTDLGSLRPDIDLAPGVEISPGSGEAQDFTAGAVRYTVIWGAAKREYEVLVTAGDVISTGLDISAFYLYQKDNPKLPKDYEAEIDALRNTITLKVDSKVDLSTLIPTVSLSGVGDLVPASGVVQDFSKGPLTYTTTSSTGVTKPYSVSVEHQSGGDDDNKIVSFGFFTADNPGLKKDYEQAVDEGALEITFTLSSGTNVSRLVPRIVVADKASIVPASGMAQDFSAPVTYTVTSFAGSAREYLVKVEVVSESENPDDREALRAIFNANLMADLPWFEETSKPFFRDWDGVDSEKIGDEWRVVGLRLARTQIKVLPNEIGLLSELKALNLFDNGIARIPLGIGRLKALRELNMESNAIADIPSAIGQLDLLQKLNLQRNRLTRLPDKIGQLENLEELRLDFNDLPSLPGTIGGLRSLKVLSVWKNKLATLPSSLTNLKKVEQLIFSDNELKSVPSTIGNMTALNGLGLSDNLLTSLPATIADISTLKILIIKDNPDLSCLPAEIWGAARDYTKFEYGGTAMSGSGDTRCD